MSAEGQGVSPTGAASGADLGGSSKHSTESTEGRAEKGSSSTAFERGLVDPKSPANAFSRAWRHGSREVTTRSAIMERVVGCGGGEKFQQQRQKAYQ